VSAETDLRQGERGAETLGGEPDPGSGQVSRDRPIIPLPWGVGGVRGAVKSKSLLRTGTAPVRAPRALNASLRPNLFTVEEANAGS